MAGLLIKGRSYTLGSGRTLCFQAAGDEPAAPDLVPTARVLVLLTDGRVDSYQVCMLDEKRCNLSCELPPRNAGYAFFS